MQASHDRVFYYHASASPFGGQFDHPTQSVLAAHGSSSLPQAGGHASTSAGPLQVDGLASCDAAHSKIFGGARKKSGGWSTMVTSIVEGLNILEIVKADRVVSKIATEHPQEGYHPRVTFVGSHFDNLRIAGVKVNPVMEYHPVPCPAGGYPSVPAIDDPVFIDRTITQTQKMIKTKGVPDWVAPRYGWVSSDKERKKRGFVVCSLVEQVEGAKPGSCFGHVIHVPGFGNVFLGELIAYHGHFRLTMIRIEMGCPADGNLSIGSGCTNGSPIP
jgi:hypothetical protein